VASVNILRNACETWIHGFGSLCVCVCVCVFFPPCCGVCALHFRDTWSEVSAICEYILSVTFFVV